jgi:ribosome biogenesis GTPase
MAQKSRVITRYPSAALVEFSDGDILECHIKRSLSELVCGDYVDTILSNNDCVVSGILPRKTVLSRFTGRGDRKNIAANIDQILIVTSASPEPDRYIIDKYIVACEITGIIPILLVNKTDILSIDELRGLRTVLALYQQLGYQVLYTSVKQDRGLDEIRQLLQQKTSVLTGKSGVGKSSIIKILIPDIDIRIGELSKDNQHGKHTTTNAYLYHVDSDSHIIDSPGIRDFGLSNLTDTEVVTGFREFHQFENDCRFHNCRHLNEPGCGIRQAVEAGLINPGRYDNYTRLLEEQQADRR